jgi:GT2 family glycosyltransferase
MDVSVIIISYNTCELTRNCLNSVIEKTYDLNYEIIVVDNASADGSAAMILQTFPQVRLVEEHINWGFGKANNIGAGYAKGSYLFLLNSDTILVNNAIKILYDYMKSNQKAGICGGQLVDVNGNNINSYGPYPSIIREIAVALFPAAWLNNKSIHCTCAQPINRFISGADMMINREQFNQLKGFDKDFFMYAEDVDLSLRFKRAGFLTCFVPDAKIIHLVNQSSNDVNLSDDQYINRWSYAEERYSRFVFLRKMYGSCFSGLIFLIYYLKGEMAAVFFYLRRNKQKINYWKKYSDIHKTQYQRYLSKF